MKTSFNISFVVFVGVAIGALGSRAEPPVVVPVIPIVLPPVDWEWYERCRNINPCNVVYAHQCPQIDLSLSPCSYCNGTAMEMDCKFELTAFFSICDLYKDAPPSCGQLISGSCDSNGQCINPFPIPGQFCRRTTCQ